MILLRRGVPRPLSQPRVWWGASTLWRWLSGQQAANKRPRVVVTHSRKSYVDGLLPLLNRLAERCHADGGGRGDPTQEALAAVKAIVPGRVSRCRCHTEALQVTVTTATTNGWEGDREEGHGRPGGVFCHQGDGTGGRWLDGDFTSPLTKSVLEKALDEATLPAKRGGKSPAL